MQLKHSLLVASLACLAAGRDVPSNVKNWYTQLSGKSQCTKPLANGFHSSDGDHGKFTYCGDHLEDYNVVFIKGEKGEFANMDIDCDGAQGTPGDDGRCGASTDTQAQTSFRDVLQKYGVGLKDLNANTIPYIVFGNVGSKAGYSNFRPQEYGIEPLSLMAVVCNNQLHYGIWGDENGDDGAQAMVGEASISLATACYGKGINGNAGHDKNDVLYIAFPGSDAVPGAKGAAWGASTYDDFAASIQSLGDKLVQRIGGGSSPSPGDDDKPTSTTTAPKVTPTSTKSKKPDNAQSTTLTTMTASRTKQYRNGDVTVAPSVDCSWLGHCAGATCSTYDDCSDDLTCINSKCAPEP